jgi:aminoglycoside 3-N-acetyltransferase I
MHIKLLKPGDEALLQRAEAEFWPDRTPSLDRAAALLREPTYIMVVALDDAGETMARVYGHVLHRFDATDLLLYEVDTVETHQRKGAATAIIDYLKQLSVERGWREMWVLTDVDNVAGNSLYRAAGGELENSPANMYVFKTGA